MQLSELARLFSGYGLGQAFVEQEALFHWPDAVGEQTARLTQPLIVREGILYVEVGSHVFAQEYTLMRETMLQRLNQRLKRPLKDIRFKVASIKRPVQKPAPMPALDGVDLDSSQQAKINELLDDIEDDRLKDALKHLFETYAKVQTVKAQQPGQKRCPGCGLYHDSPEAFCACCRLEGKR